MEVLLRSLYRLQQIDLELDDLDDSGDLPKEVENLSKHLAIIIESFENEQQKLQDIRKSRGAAGSTIIDLRERVKKLNEQLRLVRNNKEYEALSHEIESAELEIQSMERSSTTTDTQEATIIRDIDALTKQREEAQRDFDEKNATLEEIRKANTDEIAVLKEERDEVVANIDAESMKKYNHIRQNAYKDAVVRVKRGACSGCYRSITPQTVLEMRRNENMYLCEHCGRILVLDETVMPQETT